MVEVPNPPRASDDDEDEEEDVEDDQASVDDAEGDSELSWQDYDFVLNVNGFIEIYWPGFILNIYWSGFYWSK